MIKRTFHADKAVRNMVIVIVLMGLMFLVGILANLTTNPQAQDIRWATYTEPVVLGRLDPDDNVIRRVDVANGMPVGNENDQITVVTQRCGPVSDVDVRSTRTWVVEEPAGVFIRFEGDTVALTVPQTDECLLVQRDLEIPEDVLNVMDTLSTFEISVQFLLVPTNPDLGPILLESEPFVRWEPELSLRPETIRLGE